MLRGIAHTYQMDGQTPSITNGLKYSGLIVCRNFPDNRAHGMWKLLNHLQCSLSSIKHTPNDASWNESYPPILIVRNTSFSTAITWVQGPPVTRSTGRSGRGDSTAGLPFICLSNRAARDDALFRRRVKRGAALLLHPSHSLLLFEYLA